MAERQSLFAQPRQTIMAYVGEPAVSTPATVAAVTTSIARYIEASDAQPVLKLVQTGTGYGLHVRLDKAAEFGHVVVLEHLTRPCLWFAASEATDPAGRYFLYAQSDDTFGIGRAQAAGFAGAFAFLTYFYNNDQPQMSLGSTSGATAYTRLFAGQSRIILYGLLTSGTAIALRTYDGSETVERLTLTGGAVTSVAQWSNVQQSGVQIKDMIWVGSALSIASGSITITNCSHTIDTESGAATDDLDTISGGIDGNVLLLRAQNSARTVVVKHGTGNIQLDGGVDFSLDDVQDTIMLFYNSTNWLELSRSNNA